MGGRDRSPRALGVSTGGRRLTGGSVRDVLNRHKWAVGDLEQVVVTYRHRGAENDEATFRGGEIVDVGASFLELHGGTMIPYHRVLRVQVGERVVFERGKESAGL